jgi:hypothetical protein
MTQVTFPNINRREPWRPHRLLVTYIMYGVHRCTVTTVVTVPHSYAKSSLISLTAIYALLCIS